MATLFVETAVGGGRGRGGVCVVEMLMNGSLHLFSRQAAAQQSSLASLVFIESLHKRGERRQTLLCAKVLRLCGHELVAKSNTHVSSARHDEHATANFTIE